MLLFDMRSHVVGPICTLECHSPCVFFMTCELLLVTDSHGQPVSPSWKNSLGHSLPRSVRSRMLRRQSKIPQESEGIQAPDAQPITSKACLELMADKVLPPNVYTLTCTYPTVHVL